MELEKLKLSRLIIFFSNSQNINIFKNLINELNISNYSVSNLEGKFSNKKLMFTGGFKKYEQI